MSRCALSESTKRLADGTLELWAGVAGSVVFTAGAGVAFAWLRLRTRSVVAPLVAHAGINSLAMIAAFIALEINYVEHGKEWVPQSTETTTSHPNHRRT